ncbi:TNT domain-containing protein [Streptomyces sp. SID5614]|uniref:TNT domain-containing protein n=1 Tax=Streptomyces sp. SID5614 TaxID=2690306 RepID=UPI001367B326|nr:TNT domain-containing protein [Streptomyces sp. SID5614]MZG05544.1 glycohydrolase toxin TNT-related protein [Streptomyces sp. SID5614]
MNRMRTALAALGITAGLITAPAASAAPGPEKPAPAAERHEPCTGEFRGDARLGPKWLPNKRLAPVGPLLNGYQRTGDLTPKDFLKKYWEGPADTGSWKYPPNDGFAEVNGEIDKEPVELRTGQRLDRFGSEYGGYLAPAGDAYAERALPPQNLNTRDAGTPCDYRVYKVAKPFWVWQGSIAPWFEQPGGGQQIKLDAVFLDPGAGQRLNVKWLLDNGYLTPAGA